jgi:hypothetical protein
VADELTTEPTTEPQTQVTDETSKPGDDLAGLKSALDSEREQRKTAERQAKANAKAAEELEKLRAANMSEAEKATAAVEQATRRAQALVERTVRAEVRAAAADTFADPSDAAAFLDLGSYAGDDGDIDTDRITKDLADLLKRKPHLAKTPARTGPKADPSQGPKPGGTPDLAARIAQAQKDRDFPTAIALKRQQAALNNQKKP